MDAVAKAVTKDVKKVVIEKQKVVKAFTKAFATVFFTKVVTNAILIATGTALTHKRSR